MSSPEVSATSIAKALAPALAANLLNTEGMATAVDANAPPILEAATVASRQIARSGAAAAGEIRGAARQRANEVAQLIGLTSWKAALLVGLWVSEKHPEIRKAYDRFSQ